MVPTEPAINAPTEAPISDPAPGSASTKESGGRSAGFTNDAFDSYPDQPEDRCSVLDDAPRYEYVISADEKSQLQDLGRSGA